jgi:bifunctional non-homologous end joining protein LigD
VRPNRAAGSQDKSGALARGGEPLARLTHPDRVLFAAQGLTKRGLAEYYLEIAGAMLPHIARRPLVLVRCPEGRKGSCFYQKHPAQGMSDALHRIKVREKTKTEEYVFLEDVDGLIELVQFGTLEIHVWGSKVDDVERPDRIVFDLDPGEKVPWNAVIDAMREMRSLLEGIGLRSFPKSTGGKGLHVVVPIEPSAPWTTVKDFARTLAEVMAARQPARYTTNMAKRVRKGRIFIDYLRNDRGATAIAPFSTRARPGAPIAVPLSWSEVTEKLLPARFTIETVRARLKKMRKDPWEGFFDAKQPIQSLIGTLRELRE